MTLSDRLREAQERAAQSTDPWHHRLVNALQGAVDAEAPH
jgi:hypothetical protein